MREMALNGFQVFEIAEIQGSDPVVGQAPLGQVAGDQVKSPDRRDLLVRDMFDEVAPVIASIITDIDPLQGGPGATLSLFILLAGVP